MKTFKISIFSGHAWFRRHSTILGSYNETNDSNRRLIEAELNSFPNFMTTIDAVDIHFIALFSQKADAVPLLLLHGWPGVYFSMLLEST